MAGLRPPLGLTVPMGPMEACTSREVFTQANPSLSADS